MLRGGGQQNSRVLGQRPRHLAMYLSICRTPKFDIFVSLLSYLSGGVRLCNEVKRMNVCTGANINMCGYVYTRTCVYIHVK